MAIVEHYVTATGTDTWANSTSELTPCSLTTARDNAVGGDRVNIKAGTYTRTASDTFDNLGTATSPVIFRGYSSTIGDGNLGRTTDNLGLITTNMPTIAYGAYRWNGTDSTFCIIESLLFTSTVAAPTIILGENGVIKNCSVTNSSTDASATGITLSARTLAYDCDVTLNGASGASCAVSMTSTGGKLVNCYVKGGPINGVLVGYGSVVIGNIIHSQAGAGIIGSGTDPYTIIYGNTIVAGTGNGIEFVANSVYQNVVINNMITDNGGFGIDANGAQGAVVAARNRTRDNTGGATSGADDWLAATSYGHVTTDTGDYSTDYTDYAAKNFTLIAASPAKATGWLKFTDIGALQRQEPSGGSGGGFPILGGSVVR